jgi:membrane AbrB-like protein
MFATSLLNISGFYPVFPVWVVSFLSNVMVGIMIGRQVDRSVWKRIKLLARRVLLLSVGMLTLSFVSGYTLYLLIDTSLATALISGAAGGITEMIIFGMSVNADVTVIMFIQLFRVVTFLTLVPYLTLIAEKMGGRKKTTTPSGDMHDRLPVFGKNDYVVLVICAFVGACAGRWLRVPTGAMLGAMFACGALVLSTNKRYFFDTRLRHITQIALGLVTGARMTPETIGHLGKIFFPAVVVTVVMFAGCALLAVILYKVTDWDLSTCLLCASPAGLSQITVFAEEIGADIFTASVFHTVRIISIISIYPWITMPFIGV